MNDMDKIYSAEDMQTFSNLAEEETRQQNAVGFSMTKRNWHDLLLLAVTSPFNSAAPSDLVMKTKSFLEELIQKIFRHDMGCRWTLTDALDKVTQARSSVLAQAEEEERAFIETYNGLEFTPFNPSHVGIVLADIAHALSNICRFGGHTGWFYSVAQHSVAVSRACPRHLALEGLLHEASVAYLGDLRGPLKKLPVFAFFRHAEANLAYHVKCAFDLTYPAPEEVKAADKLVLATEFRDLMQFLPEASKYQEAQGCPVLPERIVPLDSIEAEQLFLDEFDRLSEEREQALAQKREG